MITFVQDGISLLDEEFSVLNKEFYEHTMPEAILRSSFIGSSYNKIFEFHYKRGYGVENIVDWKSTQDGVGIATFENAHGKKFALRVDLLPSAVAKFGRERFKEMFGNNKPRISVPYSQEVKRRGVEIEHIVGFILLKHAVNPDVIPLVIVEIVSGAERIFEITESISFQMGQILHRTHKLGVIHAHPHIRNWVLVDRKPRLVDGKGMLLDCDFPWNTCTGRIHTFERMASNDCAHVLYGELGTVSKNFDAFNDGYRSI